MMMRPPEPPKGPARSLPKFCSGCGRELVIEHDNNGHDPYDGTPTWDEWLTCPRWHKSWRNLFMGGNDHDSISADPHIWLERTWR